MRSVVGHAREKEHATLPTSPSQPADSTQREPGSTCAGESPIKRQTNQLEMAMNTDSCKLSKTGEVISKTQEGGIIFAQHYHKIRKNQIIWCARGSGKGTVELGGGENKAQPMGQQLRDGRSLGSEWAGWASVSGRGHLLRRGQTGVTEWNPRASAGCV